MQKLWQYIKRGTSSDTLPSMKQLETITQSFRCYQDISHLPLSLFIEITINNDLRFLTIEGQPTELQLAQAWQNILAQYSDAIGDQEFKLYTNLLKEVTILSVNLQLIHHLVDTLWKIYDERLAKELNQLLGTSFKFNPHDNESYQNELARCINRSKSLKIKLTLKMTQFEALEKKQVKNTKPTYEYYDSILITLSDHAKYQLYADDMTVFQYCERINRLNKYLENLQNRHPN